MNISDLIKVIHKDTNDLDLISARRYIEANFELLEANKYLLQGNAREILNFLIEQRTLGINPLTRKELTILSAVNSHAYTFDVSGIKSMIKLNTKLFVRDDAIAYLNKDAITILKGMGVIKDDEKLQLNQ